MSTEASITLAAEAKPTLTEKETKLLVVAFMSLKSGVPEIDYARFQKNGDFKTLKTAQNTWGVLKKKIIALNPGTADSADKGPPTTPKSTPKKRNRKESDGEDAGENCEAAEEGSAKKKVKTPRKKKADADADADAEAGAEGGDGSPKKKTPRKTPVKKASAKKIAVKVEEEDPAAAAASEATTEATAVKADEKKENVADEEGKIAVPTSVTGNVEVESSADD